MALDGREATIQALIAEIGFAWEEYGNRHTLHSKNPYEAKARVTICLERIMRASQALAALLGGR